MSETAQSASNVQLAETVSNEILEGHLTPPPAIIDTPETETPANANNDNKMSKKMSTGEIPKRKKSSVVAPLVTVPPPKLNSDGLNDQTEEPEGVLYGKIFFILGFFLFPMWFVGSVYPTNPFTFTEKVWLRRNRIAASLAFVVVVSASLGISLYFATKQE